jgi:hypothetical protein
MHSIPLESYRPRVWREADDRTDLDDPVESKPHDPVPVQRRLAFIQLGGVALFGQVNLIFRIVAPPKLVRHDQRRYGLTGITKNNQAPDFSEARPIRRAVYIRPRCHQFLHSHDGRRRPL